jgi:hypothetical protein
MYIYISAHIYKELFGENKIIQIYAEYTHTYILRTVHAEYVTNILYCNKRRKTKCVLFHKKTWPEANYVKRKILGQYFFEVFAYKHCADISIFAVTII